MRDEIKILIVEDDPADAELMTRELRRSGLNFISQLVQSSPDYEAALKSFKPDIILSDYNLPSFDGVTAFHIKQKISPDIPFIIVSGTIGEDNAVELIKQGVTDYALKDKLFILYSKVIRALKEAKEQREKRVAEERLRRQHTKLMEIASLQAHQVRGPIANILGLINIINFDNPSDPNNTEVIKNLLKSTIEFDKIIRKIVQKTSEINDLR